MIRLHLQLFAEGAEGSAPNAEVSETTQQADNIKNNDVESNAGSQDVSEPEAQDREKTYKQFKEEYKDLFKADFKRQLDDRFKKQADIKQKYDELNDKFSRLNPMLENLKSRYHVSDEADLINAVFNDDPSLEQEAFERGIDVKELQKQKQLEREEAAQREIDERKQAEEESAKIYNSWVEQGEKLKELFPDFDLQTESETNELFVRKLVEGYDVKQAYFESHMSDIILNLLRENTEETKKSVLDSIASNRARPIENNGKAVSKVPTVDISKLTREQMQDLDRRAARGERITLK